VFRSTPLLSRDGRGLFFGQGGNGKTTVALALIKSGFNTWRTTSSC
jgi:hypothetical protein